MISNLEQKAEQYITPLRMNKLKGRMMRLPAKKRNKEILLVYGHHASLERVFGMAEYLNNYGAVTVPDLPGFGGMQSFYRIGRKPTIESYADYLASFVKMQYKRRRITIVAGSFSVPIVTRMLQKYPAIAKKTDLVICAVGFVHRDDIKFSSWQRIGIKAASGILSIRPVSFVVHKFVLRPRVIKPINKYMARRNGELKGLKPNKVEANIDFEVKLWRINDTRTRFATIQEMLKLDLCHKHVPLPVHQMQVDGDRYVDHKIASEHMRIIYDKVSTSTSKSMTHAPTLLANAREVAPYVTNEVKKLLRS